MKKLWRKGLASLLALAVVAVSGVALSAAPAHAVSTGITVYFQKPQSWKQAYCYTYYGSGSTGKAWPGIQMTQVSGNWYSFSYTGSKPLNVVFNDNGSPKAQQTANQKTKDLPLTKSAYWVTTSSSSSQNAGGIGGGVDINITDTAPAGAPSPAAATSTDSAKTPAASTAKDATPKTGDSSNAAAGIAVLGIAALAGAVIELRRNKVSA